jgi:hypothetical protein
MPAEISCQRVRKVFGKGPPRSRPSPLRHSPSALPFLLAWQAIMVYGCVALCEKAVMLWYDIR